MKSLLAVLCGLAFATTVSAQQPRLTPERLRTYRSHEIEEAIKEKSRSAFPQAEATEKSGSMRPEAIGEARISTSTPESEVHAAVNPADTTNIVISPIHNGTTFGMPIYYTKNFGQTWLKSAFTPNTGISPAPVITGGGDPVLAYDADGKVYMTWIDTYQFGQINDTVHWAMYWASSTNGGQTWQRSATPTVTTSWTKFVDVYHTALDTSSGPDDKQWITVDRTNSPYHNTLYVAWTKLNQDSPGVMLARKLPGVDSMERPVRVSSPDIIKVQYTSIGVDAKGGVHVTFMGSTDLQTFGIYHAYSSDGGKTFKTEVKIADADVPGQSADATGELLLGIRTNGNYPSPHLSIDTAKTGNLYMVWNALGTTDDLGHGNCIYLSRSTDNGLTWSDTIRVNRDSVWDNPIDHFYPSIAVNGRGMITVTWYDRREDPNNQITRYYMAQSFDAGQTWINAPVAAKPMDFVHVQDKNGGPSVGFGIGEYTQVLATPYYTIPVWTDDRTDDGNLRIYACFIPAGTLPAVTMSGVTPDRTTTITGGIELIEPYPNPAQASIKTGFRLAEGAHTRLLVTNILGETIASLFDGNSEAGEHDFAFDATRLPNGTYYLNLESGQGFVRRAFSITH
ncbi:MAG: hypothetical protein Q8922_08220 [Bacteroidota bacterium]|nr:hypothetical protein [Bacteroidota bacterium]MDP4233527.1 hypothetical protein [Bacteroidota bacterium]MDP4243404.1 hypothetical protein [Bacteroidota bacterium]MDP4287909.1 hypothetical protein [Bacteroidota bacterium]